MLISGNIGEKIKDLREFYGISQKDLCKGICSQAYVSRLEKGEINVSADLLFMLSKRLGVEVNFFFENYKSSRSEYVSVTMDEIKEAIHNRDYELVEEMVELELKNPLFKENLEGRQFLLWHKGICKYIVRNNIDEAMFYIDEALSCSLTTNKNYSQREIEIMLSKAIILHLTNKFNDSKKIYIELISALNKNIYITDPKIFVKSYYNFVRLLVKLNEYDEAVKNAKIGLRYAKKNELLFLQGDLYFQIARCYELMKDYIVAKKNYQLSSYCFNLSEHNELYELAVENIEEMSELDAEIKLDKS
ncbi:helix-turn-helix transcriptional regulator [Virgibacillus sp. MSP4-1]|uniref:helix-turn-helix domain-containing protein n=1 Tax=Virgibacillus sp. MSP4-1 TaxID=2700081 RepID=UPI00039E0EDC|nr:helix-turn-helix domain-containing protein [Virgibacillus sp. MSP4-1]QHS24062.1 helix-turn-helix transcriptional regulator [Virgibacillus sp. MSP4-1]